MGGRLSRVTLLMLAFLMSIAPIVHANAASMQKAQGICFIDSILIEACNPTELSALYDNPSATSQQMLLSSGDSFVIRNADTPLSYIRIISAGEHAVQISYQQSSDKIPVFGLMLYDQQSAIDLQNDGTPDFHLLFERAPGEQDKTLVTITYPSEGFTAVKLSLSLVSLLIVGIGSAVIIRRKRNTPAAEVNESHNRELCDKPHMS